jgi:putative toxin-antitoxin system antitoxin component (TIGR02293 family)
MAQVEAGVAFRVVTVFQDATALSMKDVADAIRVPFRTLMRRKVEGRLQPDEGDRLLRALRTVSDAVRLFRGDRDAARTWLLAPNVALGHLTPLAMARTDAGAREVEHLIGRLTHGIPS